MTYLTKPHGSSLRMGFFLLLGPQDLLVLIWSNTEYAKLSWPRSQTYLHPENKEKNHLYVLQSST